MSKVIADISMSLDGYIAAEGADPEHGLGIGGEAIHAWVLDEPRSATDEGVLARGFEQTGASVIDQWVAAGLVDELRLHLSPLVLGGGTRLFDRSGPVRLVQREMIESPRATHLTYEVLR